MSRVEERPIARRVPERPSFSGAQVRQVGVRELAIRFAAGALTSVVAGLVTLGFGARVGGVLLAFPAILAASLTLIAKEEDAAESREDARGAVMGGLGMAAFAAAGALALGHLDPALALLIAAAAWGLGAIGGYCAAWLN